MKLLALILAASCLSALDWSAYDKRLHATCGALGAYVICDTLERVTDMRPWQRWLIASGTMTAAGWAYENMNGTYEANDAHATMYGAMLGASVQVGVSFIFTHDKRGIEAAWRF